MPTYTIQDESGNTLTLEGDSPPTEQEMEELFASRSEPSVSAIAPWMAERQQPSSLTPQQSPFGLPESFKTAPIESGPRRPTIGPADPWETYGKVSDAELFPDEETREHLIATGQIPPRSAWENAQRPALHLPTAPTIEDSHPSEFEQALAPNMFGLMGLALGGERSSQVLREGYNVAKGVPEFMTSPLGVATLPAGMVAPRAVTGTFAYDMLKSLLDQDEELQANWDKMSEPERLRALTRMGMTGAFAGHLSRTSTKAPKFTGSRGEAFAPVRGTEQTLSPATLGEGYSRTFNAQNPVRGNVTARPSGNIAAMPSSQGGQVRTEAQRAAEEAPEDVALTPEEDSLLSSESWSVDLPVKVVQKGSRARAAANRGQLMGINFKTGEIEVYPANFRVALEGVPEAARGEFIRSRLQGEQFHKSVYDSIGNAGASKYWGNLTRAEQKLAAQIYLGRQNTTGFSRSDLGHEVIRRRLQRLENGTPEEMIGVARREKWTLKSLQLLEDVIRTTREKVPTYGEGGLKLGTKAARSNKAMMDRLDRNMAAARSAVTGSPEEDAEVAEELVADQPELGSNYSEVAEVSEASTPKQDFVLDPDKVFEEKPGKAFTPDDARIQEMSELQEARANGTLRDGFDIARLKRLEAKYGQGPASSVRGERRPDPPIPESEFPPFPKAGNRMITIRRSDGTTYRAGLDEKQSWPKEALPPGMSGDVVHRIALDKEGKPGWSTGMLDPGETIVGEPALGPAAARRGPMSKRGEDAAKLAAMKAAQSEGTMESVTEGGAQRIRGEAYEAPTPASTKQVAEQYMADAERPSFAGFTQAFHAKFGAVQGTVPNSQLREIFSQTIGDSLMASSGKRIGDILKKMGLVKNVVGGGKPGERRLVQIADAPLGITRLKAEAAAESTEALKALGVKNVTPPKSGNTPQEGRQLMMDIAMEKGPVEISKALDRALRRKGPPTQKPIPRGQGLRHRAIGEILYTLFKETEQLRKPVARKEVTPEEVGSPLTAKEPVYDDIRRSELTDVERLGQRLTSDSRTFKQPVSVTHRLVALLNNKSGSVELVDIYNDGRRGAVVMSPTGAGAHQSLESVMRTHRPIHSVLLDEPVQNFRQRFKSLKEYNDEFGTDARSRAQEAQYEEFVGEPVGDPELESGPVESSGTLARPEFRPGRGVLETEAPITDAEARATLGFVRSEIKNITSPEDVALAVESFRELIKRPIKDRPLQAISGIIKMVKSQLEQNDQLTEGQALEQVSKFIYETQSRTTPDQFVGITLANYRGRTAEAGEPVTESPGPGSRELSAPVPGERINPGIPGVTRPVQARPRIEQVGGGMRETMARGSEVRQAAAQAAVPARAEAIRQEAQGETYESAFDRVIKDTSKVAREAEAEVAKEVPRQSGETLEEWLVRVREQAALLEEFKAVQDQNKLAEGIGPASVLRNSIPVAKRLADLVHKPITAGLRVGSEWMVDRLKRVAPEGAHFTRRELDKVNQIISDQQQYSGDMFNRFGDDILRESGRLNAATKWMNDLQVVVPGKGAIVNSVEAIEGRLQPPPHARQLASNAQEANLLIGEFMEPVSPGFVANGGMSRNLNAFGYDIIRNGSGPDFRNLVESNAKANGISVRDAQKLFLKMKRVLDDPNADPAALFTVNQDFVRKMPRAITHIWTGGKRAGHWEPVIHSELFNYFNHGIRRAAMIRAFRETYPVERVRAEPLTAAQVDAALTSQMPKDAIDAMTVEQGVGVRSPDFRTVVNRMRSELPGQWHPLLNSLYRTLQGHPSENIAQTGWLNIPGAVTQPGSTLVRTLSPLGQTMKSMWLSQQIFLQPGELMSGASEIFFGYRKSALATLRYREMYPMLEAAGAVDKIMYDNAWNANSPIRASFRVFNNTVRKYTGQNLWNEMQESQAAGAAYINAQRILASVEGEKSVTIKGKTGTTTLATNPNALTWTERNLLPQTFRVMGFNPGQVRRMMLGDAELLGQMVRKAASFASGGHMHPAEQSRLSANRAFQGMFWFQRYPMTRLNQFQKLWTVLTEETKAGRKKEARNTAILMAKFMGGATQQGLLQTAILTGVYGGFFALALKFQEAQDEPFAFMFDMWRSAMGGPFQLATRGWEDSGLHGVANNFKRLAAPVNIAGDVYDVANGTGAYNDMDLTTRIGKYLQRSIPLSKTVKFGMSAWGLSQDDYKLDESVKALNKWKRGKFGFEDRESHWKEDESKAFKIQMKKAVEAIKDGDTDKYLEAIIDAAGGVPAGKDPLQSVQDSFRARQVLRNPQTGEAFNLEETEELINRIGDDAYDRLQALDLMLLHASGAGD